MHYTHRYEIDFAVVVEFVECVQSADHLRVHVFVQLSAVVEMQQSDKDEHKLHHTAVCLCLFLNSLSSWS